jgi:hypothetical protein
MQQQYLKQEINTLVKSINISQKNNGDIHNLNFDGFE